jgi:spore coat polysaccharide biosynthesis protein SpsF
MKKIIGVIIQARMNSTRLPGKVLLMVKSRPLLSYLIERLGFCKSIGEIVLATTINPSDNPIADFAKEKGLLLYRGSENDVLDRYYQASSAFQCQHIMRITADCPLIDPGICDRVAEYYLHEDFDYVVTGPSFAEGVDCEIFSFQALKTAWERANLKSEREHVTLFFLNHPEIFRSLQIENETDDSRYRITVDQPEDFQLVKLLLEALYQDQASCFTIAGIKAYLNRNPDILAINRDVIRNEGLLRSRQED